MVDKAHLATDELLDKMERRLRAIYTRASREIGEAWKAYLKEAGTEIAEAEYNALLSEIREKASLVEQLYNGEITIADVPTEWQEEIQRRVNERIAAEDSKLPNPYPLTFTGAVNETYDGSSAKTIEIPSGGAHEGIYSLLVEHTITEDVSEVVYTNEEYPGIANLKHILVSIIFPEKQTTGWWKLVAGDVVIMSTTGVSNVKHYYGAADVKCGHWIWSGAGSSNDSAGQKLSPPAVEFNPRIGFIPTVYNDYSSLRIYGNSFTLTAGTVVRIWGCE